CVSPTLMREVSTFVYESVPPFFSDPLFLKYEDARTIALLKEPARQQEMKTSAAAQRYKAALDVASRKLKKLSDAGVTIAIGTAASAAAKPILECVPSQNGLFVDPPQRQSANGRFGIVYAFPFQSTRFTSSPSTR